MEEKMTFEEIESTVTSRSVAYNTSMAFREALAYVSNHDEELYRFLIELEYKEAFE